MALRDPTGRWAQVDIAYFKDRFEEDLCAEPIVGLSSLLLSHRRTMCARFVAEAGEPVASIEAERRPRSRP